VVLVVVVCDGSRNKRVSSASGDCFFGFFSVLNGGLFSV